MKHITTLTAVLSVAALIVGCNKEEPTTSQQLDKAKAETKEVGQSIRDYTYVQKADYVKDMRAQIADLNQDLDKLSAKIDSSTDAIKAEEKPKLQALREQSEKMNKQLDEVQNASESTWNTVKDETQKAWNSFKEGVTDSRQWVSEKIAP